MKDYIIKFIRKSCDFSWGILTKTKMKMRILFVIIVFISQIMAMNIVNAQTKKIYPVASQLKYVNDYAKVLDSESTQYILSVGKELEAKTGAQAIVVVIGSLKDVPIETYATGIFREWGISQKGKNNGLLILLSVKEKQWRVEVGTGLEGAVTDIYSSRVMNDYAVPKFKQGLYGEGLRASYSLLCDSVAKEYNVKLDKNINVPKQVQTQNIPRKGNGIVLIGFIVLIFLDFILNRGRVTRFMVTLLFWSSIGRRGGGNGGGFGGSGGGGFGGGSGGFGGGSSSGGGSSGGY
ncbi:TPM domain-containing protein [Clostridium estertheticum]|uniref:TPM domain-containing protein n=1 Tax=Clostridium estertheticum TaxID=238834 RepID=UPI001CF5F708|nr:TPM domain-containing protein [Clostridium estertheticum]MCB2306320.1 TPM domain-containing protein [Clostridium estertheticum]MCB2344696.1 TPM domain-containing protein [Clostridium estertheticum]MCB2349619.1 TPM domain-containing protein [Clostridium estertheticum]WAG46782.1 TPM domain-containing protein [Clostridium estertheticum]